MSWPWSEETFDQQLERVEADLVNEWPTFREKWLFLLWDTICADVGFDDPILDCEEEILERQFESLNEYSKCLELMARYPKKKDVQHKRSLKEATEGRKPTDFLQFIWESFSKCTSLGGPLNLQPTWVNAAIRYLVSLFNLAGVGENNGAAPILLELPLQSKMIQVSIHCLLFAEDIFARQNSAWVYEMICSDTEPIYVDVASEFYFEKLGDNPASVKLFDRLLVSTPGHDTWLCNVIRIFTHTISTWENATWEHRKKAVLCSMGLLGRHLQTEVDVRKYPSYNRWASYVFLSNPALEKVFDDNTVSAALKLAFLGDILRDHESARWMINSAIMMIKLSVRTGIHELDDLEKSIFLFSSLLRALNFGNTKRDQAEVAQQDKIKSLLAQKLKTSWKEVLDALRQARTTAIVHRQSEVEGVIKNWSLLGSIIGVPYLVKPPIGCFNPTCPLFVFKTDCPTPRCSRCLQSQYCGVECQNSDWKAHKPHCKKLTET